MQECSHFKEALNRPFGKTQYRSVDKDTSGHMLNRLYEMLKHASIPDCLCAHESTPAFGVGL